MIQELLEASNKIAIAGALSSTSPPSSTPSSPVPPLSSDHQNLKCPRCDSTNTKFCYYNNYNLTQPRHFCKTCRRYWTKGGALRNVPIGGGCRKVKNSGAICRSTKTRSLSSSSANPAIVKSTLGPHGFEQELSSNQILWSSPSNSHLLSLLRSPAGNSNPNPNAARIKEEVNLNVSHLVPDASLLRNALNARNLGIDCLSQVPLGLSMPWINNQHQEGGLFLGETGIQELYQRMRSNGQYLSDRHGKSLGELGPHSSSMISSFTPTAAVSASSNTASGHGILESGTMAGGEFGYWGSPFAWADMPAMNGSFP